MQYKALGKNIINTRGTKNQATQRIKLQKTKELEIIILQDCQHNHSKTTNQKTVENTGFCQTR